MSTKQAEQTELQPFHETIVEAIRRCADTPSREEIDAVIRLIRETRIPTGHDAIISALEKHLIGRYPPGEEGIPLLNRLREAKKSLLAQKKFAEVDKHKNAVLDELEREREVARMRRE